MDHHFRLGANGAIDELADRNVYGQRPTGFYIPRYRNFFGDKRGYLRGFGYQGSASRQGGSARSPSSASAARSRTRWRRRGRGRSAPPRSAKCCRTTRTRITIDETKKDKWGLPVVAIDCATGENERLMRTDMMNDMAEMLEATGVKNVRVYDNTSFPGMGIHEMGTARMGRDPKTSVLNAHSQVWDCTNVFVTDGSGMVSSGCQNPSLTYMALTARAAAFAVDELKRGNL